MTTDDQISGHIERLVEEEQALRARHSDGSGLSDEEQARMEELRVELDRYWDLLRRRRSAANAGADPDSVGLIDSDTVEGYLQ